MKKWHVVTLLAVLGVVAAGLGIRWIPPKRAKAVSPVIAELESYREKNGDYNLETTELESVRALAKSFKIYFGNKTSADSIEWIPHEVSAHDFSILTYGTGYSIFLPTSKIKPYSISSFWVWQYSSEESKWQRGKIYWSLMGSFWAEK